MPNKKKYDDTDLEWYGLTEEDMENIKNEEDFVDWDIVLLEAQIRVLLENNGLSVSENIIQSFLNKVINANVQYKI